MHYLAARHRRLSYANTGYRLPFLTSPMSGQNPVGFSNSALLTAETAARLLRHQYDTKRTRTNFIITNSSSRRLYTENCQAAVLTRHGRITELDPGITEVPPTQAINRLLSCQLVLTTHKHTPFLLFSLLFSARQHTEMHSALYAIARPSVTRVDQSTRKPS